MEIEIEYIFQHKKDRDTQREVFTLDEIENGIALDYVNGMKQDGYILLNRVVNDYLG